MSDDEGDDAGEYSEELAPESREESEASEDGEAAEGGPAPEAGGPALEAPAPAVDQVLRAGNRHHVVVVVPEDERVTDCRLQRGEMALVVAVRASQIAKGSAVFTDVGGLRDPVEMAKKELYDRQCPLVLRRAVGATPAGEPVVEDWCVRTMVLP